MISAVANCVSYWTTKTHKTKQKKRTQRNKQKTKQHATTCIKLSTTMFVCMYKITRSL